MVNKFVFEVKWCSAFWSLRNQKLPLIGEFSEIRDVTLGMDTEVPARNSGEIRNCGKAWPSLFLRNECISFKNNLPLYKVHCCSLASDTRGSGCVGGTVRRARSRVRLCELRRAKPSVIDGRSGAGMGEMRCGSLNLRICRTLSAVQRPWHWSAIGRQLRSPRDVARETRSRPSRPLFFSFRGWVCGRRLALTWSPTGEGSGGVGRLGLCLLPGGAVGGGWSGVVEDVCRVIRALSLPVLSARRERRLPRSRCSTKFVLVDSKNRGRFVRPLQR